MNANAKHFTPAAARNLVAADRKAAILAWDLATGEYNRISDRVYRAQGQERYDLNFKADAWAFTCTCLYNALQGI